MKKYIILLLLVSLSLTSMINDSINACAYSANSSALDLQSNPLGWTNESIDEFNDFLSAAINHSDKRTRDYSNNYAVVNPSNSNEIILYVDDSMYILYEENEDIFLKNSNNKTLKILDTEYTDTSTRASNGAYSLSNDNQYTSDIGPYTKTSVHFIDALTFISDTAGYMADHPVLGTIYIAASVANEIMQESGYMTSYIKYWQANKKTDMSYVREKQNWYSSSSYSTSSFIKNYTRYFDTERP